MSPGRERIRGSRTNAYTLTWAKLFHLEPESRTTIPEVLEDLKKDPDFAGNDMSVRRSFRAAEFFLIERLEDSDSPHLPSFGTHGVILWQRLPNEEPFRVETLVAKGRAKPEWIGGRPQVALSMLLALENCGYLELKQDGFYVAR